MLRTHEQDGVMVVTVQEDRLDGSNADDFKDALIQLVEQGRERFVLDISKVEFIDSKGIGVLVALHKKLQGTGECGLCCLKPNVQKIFSISRINRLLPVYGTQDEAVAGLQG
jgi:anti-sigma B factor antagonist